MRGAEVDGRDFYPFSVRLKRRLVVLQELALNPDVVVADGQHGDAVGLLRRALAGAVREQLLLQQHQRLLRVLQRLSVPPQLR